MTLTRKQTIDRIKNVREAQNSWNDVALIVAEQGIVKPDGNPYSGDGIQVFLKKIYGKRAFPGDKHRYWSKDKKKKVQQMETREIDMNRLLSDIHFLNEKAKNQPSEYDLNIIKKYKEIFKLMPWLETISLEQVESINTLYKTITSWNKGAKQ
jgi:hypothetical protein